MHTSGPSAGQPLGRQTWEGVHRTVTREPGDLPALSLMLWSKGWPWHGTFRSSDEPCGRGRTGIGGNRRSVSR